MGNKVIFKKVEIGDMKKISEYFRYEPGRTCDVSFGGILMWAPLFGYEFAEIDNILIIRSKSESGEYSYYMPLGEGSLESKIELLHSIEGKDKLELYPLASYYLAGIQEIHGAEITECPGLGDYIYDIEQLATLRGKKMSKKRNHVNQFENNNPGWSYEPLGNDNIEELLNSLSEIEKDAQQTEGAILERKLTEEYLRSLSFFNKDVYGGIIKVDGKPVGFSVGDVRGDTLFVQIEKARRDINGAHEIVNKQFAADMLSRFPNLKYINREEDAGDPGLRYAKESYHPIEILEKFRVKI